jgi:hypothetical protein
VSAGQIQIVLKNLQANPTDVAQLISDFHFTIGRVGSLTGSTLSSSSGQELTVNGNNTFSLGGTVSTGWSYAVSAGVGTLNVLGTPIGPAHLIIGPPGGATYSNANGSIAGNGPHNPFLNQSATFTISASTVTADTTITSVTFSFGTTSGVEIPGITSSTPEPTTLATLATGLPVGLLALRRRFRHQQTDVAA